MWDIDFLWRAADALLFALVLNQHPSTTSARRREKNTEKKRKTEKREYPEKIYIAKMLVFQNSGDLMESQLCSNFDSGVFGNKNGINVGKEK